MNFYQLKHLFNEEGGQVFRAVVVAESDVNALIQWALGHQNGREHTKSSFGNIRYKWNGPKSAPEADFPIASEPGGIWSERAISVVGGMLLKSGDIHQIILDDATNTYFLYDCWVGIDVVPNDGFNSFVKGSLKSITIAPDVELPDVFMATNPIGLMVSEKFKQAAEATGLTGMVFTEVEVIQSS